MHTRHFLLHCITFHKLNSTQKMRNMIPGTSLTLCHCLFPAILRRLECSNLATHPHGLVQASCHDEGKGRHLQHKQKQKLHLRSRQKQTLLFDSPRLSAHPDGFVVRHDQEKLHVGLPASALFQLSNLVLHFASVPFFIIGHVVGG